MYLSIIFLPLLGCIASGFFGRKVGIDGARLITSLSVIITTILAILGFFEIGFNNLPVTINLFRWIDSEWYNIIWGFQFDSLTVAMLIPVLIISSLVHIYSMDIWVMILMGVLLRENKTMGINCQTPGNS